VSGEDATIVPFLAQGGHGCISVTANVAPRHCADLHDAWRKRDFDTVAQINDRLMPLHEALFVESSPGPVKYAASQLGLCHNRLRLPMICVTTETETKVRDAMTHAGLIN
jgi:4-hydroxy-tetrahydrodipicolinate synthase